MIADKHLVRSVCCGEGGEIIDDSMRVVRFVSKLKIEARTAQKARSKMLCFRRIIRTSKYVRLSDQDDGQTKYVSTHSEVTQDSDRAADFFRVIKNGHAPPTRSACGRNGPGNASGNRNVEKPGSSRQSWLTFFSITSRKQPWPSSSPSPSPSSPHRPPAPPPSALTASSPTNRSEATGPTRRLPIT